MHHTWCNLLKERGYINPKVIYVHIPLQCRVCSDEDDGDDAGDDDDNDDDSGDEERYGSCLKQTERRLTRKC